MLKNHKPPSIVRPVSRELDACPLGLTVDMRILARLSFALLTALAAATGAHAQALPDKDSGTVIPVWNQGSGKVEALLYLEPTGEQKAGARWHFGRNSLDAAFGLSSGDSLGLLCNSSRGTSISGLASHCMLATLGDDEDDTGSRHASGTIGFNRGGTRLGLTAGTGRDNLPAWLTSSVRSPAARVEQNDLTVFGQKNIGREGFVSIGGTFAKARLVPLSDAAPGLAERMGQQDPERRRWLRRIQRQHHRPRRRCAWPAGKVARPGAGTDLAHAVERSVDRGR